MSIATELTRIQTAKANLKTQIEAKGVSVPSTATIDTYATYVQQIPQGGGGGTDYFKITNRTATAGTITFTQSGSVHNLVLKLSTDGTNWTNYDMSATTTVVLPANGYVMIDGNNNKYVSYDSNKRWQISADVDHDISGKLSSLIGNSMNPSFGYLFFKDTHLINASGLSLDYIVLAAFAYSSMFQGCSNLVSIPELPATTLSDYCYNSMFQGCTSLTTAPALPATTAPKQCYANMFQDCTSLVTAPELPATTLSDNCYATMFKGCTSLVAAPELPASAISQSCYYSMFQDCTSLIAAPVLSATTLKVTCYSNMFRGCTSLTSITCLAMTTANANATNNWVTNINTTGTLYVASGNSMNWAQGNNGYPSTWNMEIYTEPSSAVNITITGVTSTCIGDPYEGGCKPYSSITFTLHNDGEGEDSAWATLEDIAYMPGGSEVMWELANSGITREVTSITYDDTTDTLTFIGEFDTGSTHLVKCMATELTDRFLYMGEAVDENEGTTFDGSTSVTLSPDLSMQYGPLRTLIITGVTFPSDEGETLAISDNDKFYFEATWNSQEMTYDTSNSWLAEDWFSFDFDDTEGEVRITADWALYSDGGEYTVDSKFETMGQCIDPTQQSLLWDDADEFEKTMTFGAGAPCAEE